MLDKLKSLFVVEDEEVKKTNASDKTKSGAPTGAIKNERKEVPISSISPSSGKVNSKFLEVLLKAMDANDLDGFDYLEFKQSLKSLEKMPMDEPTRFKSAYAMAQTMGATPEHLIKTADHYIKVLLSEEEKFEQALVNQRSRQIGDKENQIKQFENLIKEKTKMIDQLKAEIKKHTAEQEKMKKDISKATIKVESTKNDFHASFNHLVSQIKKDVENMKNYLK